MPRYYKEKLFDRVQKDAIKKANEVRDIENLAKAVRRDENFAYNRGQAYKAAWRKMEIDIKTGGKI